MTKPAITQEELDAATETIISAISLVRTAYNMLADAMDVLDPEWVELTDEDESDESEDDDYNGE